jgi:hypothetical protein
MMTLRLENGTAVGYVPFNPGTQSWADLQA